MKNNLLIFGAGGHGHVVKETAEAMGVFEMIAFLDDNPASQFSIGLLGEGINFVHEFPYAFIAIGNNTTRMSWLEQAKTAGFQLPVLIHPAAVISPVREDPGGGQLSKPALCSVRIRRLAGAALSASVRL